MRLVVCVETAGAEDGYDEDKTPTFSEHADEIAELLRMGNYGVEYVDEARDGE